MNTRILLILTSGIQHFANEAAAAVESFFLANAFTPGADNWVQLSPFGDFPNVDKSKKKVIQRFRKEDAEHICNEFNGVARKVTQPFGMPFYVGHPDHPRFKGQAGHEDTRAHGRGKEMAVRHDPSCAKCADFANSQVPCADHGLFVKMHWSPTGEQLIANEAFHGHSVNWAAVPDGAENGVAIVRPTKVKSAGFTNENGIPVAPITLANEEAEAATSVLVVPPALKLIAGFKADEDVTMEQVIEALKKTKESQHANESALEADALLATIFLANDADGDTDVVPPWLHEALGTKPEDSKDTVKAALQDKVTKAGHMDRVKKTGAEMEKARDKHYKARSEMEQALANVKAEFASERQARATLIVEQAIKSGKILTAAKEAKIQELANAGAEFDTKATEFANGKAIVKTEAKSKDLAGKHTVIEADARTRTAKFEELMSKREQEFPNEDYQTRFEAVANSAEGTQLFAAMQRPEAASDKH